MMQIKLEIDENTLKEIIYDYLQDKLGSVEIETQNIQIMVKSKQNYKSEWEIASFKAVYERAFTQEAK